MEFKKMHISNKVNCPRTKIRVNGVVVHWTANLGKGAGAEANRNYFQDTTRAASCHLNVDDKKLVECMPWRKGEAEMAYHVGATKYKSGIQKKLGDTKPNRVTIGLEICVNADGDFKKTYRNAIEVVAMMLKEHDLDLNDLYRHYDVTGKNCPAFFVENSWAAKFLGKSAASAWAEFRAEVARALGKNCPAFADEEAEPDMMDLGDKGDVVKRLQENLNKLGAKLTVDGDFGSGTEKALIEFQKKHKLSADGIAGPTTLAKILELLKSKAVVAPKVAPAAGEVFRVRESWNDAASQIGAFKSVESAKELADKYKGHAVFDSKGNLLYKCKPVIKAAPAAPKVKYAMPKGALKVGSKGSEVTLLQKALNAAGFKLKGKADGVFGQDTLQALKRFQAVHANPADGIAGQKTYEALSKAVNK